MCILEKLVEYIIKIFLSICFLTLAIIIFPFAVLFDCLDDIARWKL